MSSLAPISLAETGDKRGKKKTPITFNPSLSMIEDGGVLTFSLLCLFTLTPNVIFTLTPNVITLENLLVTEDGLYTLLFYLSFKQELQP